MKGNTTLVSPSSRSVKSPKQDFNDSKKRKKRFSMRKRLILIFGGLIAATAIAGGILATSAARQAGCNRKNRSASDE